MKNSINLLVDKKDRIKKTDSLRVLRITAIGLLFIISSSSIILFILISLSPLPNLRIQENLANTSLSQYKTDMAKLHLIKERTDVAQMILTKRRSYDQALEKIQSLLPNGVEVEAVKVENNLFSLTVSSKSLDSLNKFVSSLTGVINEKKIFSKILLGNLAIETTKNRYLVTIILTLV